MKKYVLIPWPHSQLFMDHPRFNECYVLADLDNKDVLESAHFVPEDLYEELRSKIDN